MLRTILFCIALVSLLPARAASSQPPQVHEVFLPLVARIAGCGQVHVFDYDGQERDWDWLVENFGAVWIERGNGSMCVTGLRAIDSGDNTLIIRVQDRQGQPLSGVPVVFYYSTAPMLPPELVGCFDRGDVAYTKWPPDPGAGTVGFGLYGGAWYSPPGGGPHTVWVGVAGSDCVHGLGMLAGTNHNHLNLTFTAR